MLPHTLDVYTTLVTFKKFPFNQNILIVIYAVHSQCYYHQNSNQQSTTDNWYSDQYLHLKLNDTVPSFLSNFEMIYIESYTKQFFRVFKEYSTLGIVYVYQCILFFCQLAAE